MTDNPMRSEREVIADFLATMARTINPPAIAITDDVKLSVGPHGTELIIDGVGTPMLNSGACRCLAKFLEAAADALDHADAKIRLRTMGET